MSHVQAPEYQPAVSKPEATLLPERATTGAARATSSMWLWAWLAAALGCGLLYMFAVPPWQHPDEPTHFEHIRLIAEAGRLPDENEVSLPLRWEIARSMLAHNFWGYTGSPEPVLDDESLSKVGVSPIGIYTFTQPRLYYAVAAAWLWPWLGQPVEIQLYAVRFLSVLLNLIIVACGYLTARLVFPRQPVLAAAVAGFLVFEPELTDIMSAANNDALANALSAVFFLAVAVLYFRGRRWLALAAAVVALAAGLLTKTTAVIPLISAPLAMLCYPWRRRTALIMYGALALLAVAGLGLAALLYFGPASLQREVLAAVGKYFRVQVTDTWALFVNSTRTVSLRSTARVVFGSFWAAFGWRNVVLDGAWYWLPGAAMAGAGLGLALQAGRRTLAALQGRTTEESARRAGYLLYSGGAVLVAWAITILRSQAVQSMNPYLSHGRYAFVTIGPFGLLLAAGLLGWLPESWQRRGLLAFLLAAMAFDALAFWGYLVPFYYFHT
jgi:4-amino-4-deoxy-L-arabinose transferase-like glycosyltransferase